MKNFYAKYPRLVHLMLFVLALVTTTIAGTEHSKAPFDFVSFTDNGVVWHYTWDDVLQGLWFSVPFLAILSAHEFGHYFMARKYKLNTSLPFYIPMWFPGLSPAIGTMGAVIKMREAVKTTKQYFDIGIAGPLAGFVLAMVVLVVGFLTLPPQEHLLKVDPQYQYAYDKYGRNEFTKHLMEPQENALKAKRDSICKAEKKPSVPVSMGVYKFGKSLMFALCEKVLVSDPSRIPDQYNIMHYPLLFAAYWALFFTALNLLPIGQLDGGHVIYGLFGYKRHKVISITALTGFLLYAGLGLEYFDQERYDTMELLQNAILYFGFIVLVYWKIFEEKKNVFLMAISVVFVHFMLKKFMPEWEGYSGWLFAILLYSRVLGVVHPPAYFEQELDVKRKILGWVCLVIFVLCFVPAPVDVQEIWL